MQKRKFDIKVSLITAIAVFVLSHAIIPHDHHYSHKQNLFEHNETKNQNHEDNHCFAINAAIAQSDVKTSKISVFKKITDNFNTILSSKTFKPFGLFSVLEQDFTKFSSIYFTENIPVRGSPSV